MYIIFFLQAILCALISVILVLYYFINEYEFHNNIFIYLNFSNFVMCFHLLKNIFEF